jgi:hypothetical protein
MTAIARAHTFGKDWFIKDKTSEAFGKRSKRFAECLISGLNVRFFFQNKNL